MAVRFGDRVIIVVLAIVLAIDANERIEKIKKIEKIERVDNVLDPSEYRLPREILPISYDLFLNTGLADGDFSYDGKVWILLDVLKPTDRIVVNVDKLRIRGEETSVQEVGSSNCRIDTSIIESKDDSIASIRVKDQIEDKEMQFYTVKLFNELRPSLYRLTLEFQGEISDGLFGFYRTGYTANGTVRWMGVTQFSPVHARKAFPCMDEPHFKATFTLHIGHSVNETVTSNMPVRFVKVDRHRPDYRVTTFQPTVRMSTYIVGWAVHGFVPETSKQTGSFKIWTRETMTNRGSLALNRGHSIYKALTDWLAIEDPAPKLDHLAVPDFNFNAMENWGMITFRESVVLFEDDSSPTRAVINGLQTMAHEYAHTWFGNLVTPEFWSYAWLKEGFASYFQSFAFTLVEPTWRTMERFVVDTLQPSLVLDSAPGNNRTMNGRGVGSPRSVAATLDFVTYRKGASVIRMLCHVLGEETFRKGLQQYLRKMSYLSARPSDLYEQLQSAYGNSRKSLDDVAIEDFVESWANQPGYPLLTIQRNSTTLIVQQEVFRSNRSQTTVDKKWWIPINYAIESTQPDFSSTVPTHWLRPNDDRPLIIGPVDEDRWVVLNVQQTGFYRVNYDPLSWSILTRYLRSERFDRVHRVNRAALIDDSFNLAKAGYLDYSVPLELARYLSQETEYAPWVAAVNNLMFLNRMLAAVPDVQRSFQVYAFGLLERSYLRLGYAEVPDENWITKLYRELILSACCSVNSDDCLRRSAAMFGSWISTEASRVPRDLRSFVYCQGVRRSGKTEWRTMRERLARTELHTEQELLMNGLGCTGDPDLIDEYLNWSVSDVAGIREQYRITVFNAVLDGNPGNVDRTLEFVRRNLRSIADLRGHDFLGKIITVIGDRAITADQLEKMRSLVEEEPEVLGSATDAAVTAIATATRNVDWINEYSGNIGRYLRTGSTNVVH